MAAPNSLMILTDTDVQRILGNLGRAEIEGMQASLRSALHEYSTGNQDQPCCHTNQKERMVIENSNGTTSLVIPARSSVGLSLKVVTVAAPQKPSRHSFGADESQISDPSPHGSLTLMDTDAHPFAFINADEVTAFRTALASSLLIVRRSKVKAITIFGSGKQAFWHLRLALLFHGKTIENVYIHSHHLAHSSKQFFKTFVGLDHDVKKEEGWHHTKFSMLSSDYAEHARLVKAQLRSSDIIICATPSEIPLFDETILTNPSGRIKGRLIIAVGSFKPEMIELPPALLKQAVKHHGNGRHIRKRALEGGCVLVDTTKANRQVGELIQADLGMNHIVEIGEIVMLVEQFAHEIDGSDDEEIAVDESEPHQSPDGIRKETGMSGMATAISEITNISRRGSRRGSKASHDGATTPTESEATSNTSWVSYLSLRKRRHGLNDHHEKKQSKDERDMTEWLARGNVIYKSVGLGLMDLVVGNELVKLAKDGEYGTIISDF
ncbi:hypothetical protein BJ878DRAFT_509453 [Calycina marina]|uniref:NAD(P)-binding protein n=1 Tax=Calycina marina TaxID=1763456 RepID=A0A9P7Z2L4_9HELO|nr:hypothetical protein BJ878DRAFT_509453 [Calycina marina]